VKNDGSVGSNRDRRRFCRERLLTFEELPCNGCSIGVARF